MWTLESKWPLHLVGHLPFEALSIQYLKPQVPGARLCLMQGKVPESAEALGQSHFVRSFS